jgi:plasmid maintenance system antidote protein VapI
MRHGSQTQLARSANVTVQFINELLSARKNSSPLVAKKLAEITASNPFIWMRGGDIAARRATVEIWAANLTVKKTSVAEQGENGNG